MLDLLDAIQGQLESEIDYAEIVAVMQHDTDRMPDFELRGIVVAPVSEREERIAVRCWQKVCRVRIVCMIFRDNETNSLLGDGVGQEGVIKMVEDVIEALRMVNFSGLVQLTGDEFTEAETSYEKTWSPEREGFYHEAGIEGEYRLQPFTE